LNKKIDGELYAIFQEYSYPDENKRTIVKKKNLPTTEEMASLLGVSKNTVTAHKKILKEYGYIVEEKGCYILPGKEDIYFDIPLDTLKFINTTLQEHVIKIYIYLGQRWKYKGNQYVFSLKELAEHLGINLRGNYARHYEALNNALVCLNKLGLVDWENFDENINGIPVPYKRLTFFSTKCPKKE
jgi:biotin operon repressor